MSLRHSAMKHEDSRDDELENVIVYHDNFENYTGKIFNVVCFLRANFLTPKDWNVAKMINAFITTVMMATAIYSTVFSMLLIVEDSHTPFEMANQLLIIAWAIQAIVSMIFLVYWQLYGHLKSYNRHVMGCQQGEGLAHGSSLIKRNITWFYIILFLEVTTILAFEIKFRVDPWHSEFVDRRAAMFYYIELRPINTLVTLYSYVIWHISMFLYITYTNTAYVEVRYYNTQMEQLDGSAPNVEDILMKKLEVYGRLAGVIRELDRIFRLYSFIMLIIIVPSVIFTLSMMNQRIHGWKDLFICLPSIALSAYSFLGVTVAPARLHDEVNRSKSCLLQNHSIWFPYRKDVYQIANTLCQHMEQYDLGISIWGFAILSRPLILATFSVMTMVLSVLIELTPHQHPCCQNPLNHTHTYINVNRSKSCLLQNHSIWFPYRKDVYQIANTLCQHMEQYDLGISIWGFAILSRPLILATFSVMTMVLSVLIELTPHQHPCCQSALNHTHTYINV